MFKQLRPYNLLGVAGLILFTVSFFVPFKSAEIHVHDTYYVFEMSYAFRNMACELLALFTVCTFLKQQLSFSILTWAHVVLTLLAFAAGILFLYRSSKAFQPNFSDWSTFQTNNEILVATIVILLIAQVLLTVNLLVGAFKGQRRQPQDS